LCPRAGDPTLSQGRAFSIFALGGRGRPPLREPESLDLRTGDPMRERLQKAELVHENGIFDPVLGDCLLTLSVRYGRQRKK
jgi:hypothetical protein